jgi:hypothetical protein
MRLAGQVACIGKKSSAYRIPVRNPEGQRLLGRPTRRWEYNIKKDHAQI